MNRKKFISALIPLGATMVSVAAGKVPDEPEISPLIPPYLKRGDTIGICSAAGYISVDDIGLAVSTMKAWGFSVKVGASVGKKDFTFGGTDEERLKDLQQMMDDKTIKAIMCARGGYGIIRIIDKLDFTKFIQHPKWMIGFSDVTILHCHINRNYGIATLHSKMCNSFTLSGWTMDAYEQYDSMLSINKCLSGEKMQYKAVVNEKNRLGVAEGILIGGNLKLIETLAGTKSDIITKGKILFVEDVNEYLYNIDRMFWNLKRTGKLSQLKGLIIGGFRIKKDDEGEEFGKTLEEIVLEKVKEYKYPVCFNFPVGHQKDNFALKCGVAHKLTVKKETTTLKEV